MKRFLSKGVALLLAAAMLAGMLAGCGSKNNATDDTGDTGTTENGNTAGFRSSPPLSCPFSMAPRTVRNSWAFFFSASLWPWVKAVSPLSISRRESLFCAR